MIKIPIEAVKDKGEDNGDVMPEPGDEVTLGGTKGIFKGADGAMAMIELKEVNGYPVEYGEHEGDDEEKPMKEGKGMDGPALLILAKKADKEAGYEE